MHCNPRNVGCQSIPGCIEYEKTISSSITIRTILGLPDQTVGTATVLGAAVSTADALVSVKRRIGYLHLDRRYDDGRAGGPDPKTITYAIWAVTYLTVHIEGIGAERSPVVRETVITAILAGLTCNPDGAYPTEDDHG